MKKIFLFLLLLPLSIFAQNADSIPVIKHSPNKAAIMSAVIPGLGQVYNKKYWKVPLLYGGFGVCIYAIDYNLGWYRKFKQAYSYRIDDDPMTIDEFENTTLSAENLRYYKNTFKRNLDIAYIATGIIYVLNIVDAYVDAQLFDFDVGENLSIRFEPDILLAPTNSEIINNQPGFILTRRIGLKAELMVNISL